MKKLAVIIVNYNVNYFLEQALLSVLKASEAIDVEIIVVDNASSDNSVEMVARKFPSVHLIANKENVGFSKANNQGIEKSNAQYILLLNPDTVVQEDTLDKCIHKMESDKKIGGLGVKMVDGKGNFLPESKRALPTPQVAFYKTFGLSSLFPKSKLFGKYHLGYLDENKNHEVEVLAGAFMLLRKNVLNKIGLLDESFFMYGEDIDLSYRIIKAGYKNFYLAETSIIHYKGESTKKGSLNYVKVFYNAMLIFANKHFSSSQAKLYSYAIYVAIFFKGLFTFLSNTVKRTFIPGVDFIVSYLGLLFIALLWSSKVKTTINTYPNEFLYGVLPVYAFVWILMTYFGGGYQKPYKISSIVKSVSFGTLLLAAIYGFLPEEFRFSRAILLLGFTYTILSMLLTRFLYNGIVYKKFELERKEDKNIIIVGNEMETKRALNLLNEFSSNQQFLGVVSDNSTNHDHYLGNIDQLEDIALVYEVDTILFCAADIPTKKVIETMGKLGNQLSYKILPKDSESIIGSDSKNTAGDLYAVDVNLNLNIPRNKQIKRIVDIFFSLLFFITLPLNIWFVKQKASYLSNIMLVLFGQQTWVGYYKSKEKSNYKLPEIKKAVLPPFKKSDKIKKDLSSSRINLLYAKNYSAEKDIFLLLSNFKYLGAN